MKKVLVIGLDSATFDLIMPWVRDRRLPNIAKLVEGGVSGELRSVIPPLSWPAWASFTTGKNPGKHGIFDFVERKPGSYNIRTLTRCDIRAKSVWSILSERGKRVGVVNVPLMYPPEQVNGVFVSGFGTPDQKSQFTFPPDLRKKMIEFGYKINVEEHYKRGSEALFLEDLHEFTESRAKAAMYLMEEYPWDLFMVVFFGTDLVQHLFWGYTDPEHPWYADGEAFRDAILNYFQKIDELIGELLEHAGDATCIILSDHGHGPLYKKWYVNSWLMEQGLLKLKKKPGGDNLLSKLGVKREDIQNILKKCGLGRILELIPDKLKESVPSQYLGLFDVDWSETVAYALTANGIFVNLKGREPGGIVNPGREYEQVRGRIMEKLSEVEDGGRVIDQVYSGEELFKGEYADRGPDILFSMSEGYRAVSDIYTGDIFLPEDSLSGTHKINGIVILNGPGIEKGMEIKGAELIDIAPTILHLMGVPVPEDMDGKVLKEALEE